MPTAFVKDLRVPIISKTKLAHNNLLAVFQMNKTIKTNSAADDVNEDHQHQIKFNNSNGKQHSNFNFSECS